MNYSILLLLNTVEALTKFVFKIEKHSDYWNLVVVISSYII